VKVVKVKLSNLHKTEKHGKELGEKSGSNREIDTVSAIRTYTLRLKKLFQRNPNDNAISK